MGTQPVLEIRDFTDPACPFAFSAEPGRYRLRWLYGDQIAWRPHMVVLSESPDDYTAKGFGPEAQADALRELQRRYGMPIDPALRPRMVATVEAARAVVAARLYAPEREAALLRRLRIRGFAGELIDDPKTLSAAARDVGIDPADLRVWRADPAVEAAMRADMAAARAPSAPARALDHKLAGPDHERRYTCPSYEIERLDDGRRHDVPGFQPVEVYEAAIANLAPELERRHAPESAAEVLEWAGEPLSTVEVAAVMGVEPDEARADLARIASLQPVGADGYWTPVAARERIAA
jgi:predicted DsbA family dithiol-disulfide isomerase